MSTITLPNIRQESAVQMHAKLKDNGVALDWTSLSDVKAYMYSDAQRVIAGKCTVEINAEDSEVLDVLYPATAPQYLGHYSLLVRCTYQGREKTFDVPVANFVERTAQATGVTVITDPEIDVELEVEDVSTSLLDGAIAAALDAAVRAEEAAAVSEADHLVAVSDHEAAVSDHTRAGTDHTRAESDHTTAAADHTQAVTDHTAAVAATAAANDAATLANTKAGLVQDKLDRADTDHTRAESDHTTAVSDHGTAGTDHTTAASDHSTAANDHTIAGNDHTQAASDHGTAAADHTLAASDHTTAAGDHDTAGDDHTQAVADHGTASTDHGTAVADHTLAASDHTTAAGDHTQAGTDHSTAAADHTTAGTDHTTAAADHTQAGSDHTQAGTDHSTAAADHTQAVADHAVMSGYDTRLGNVETEVSQLDQELIDKTNIGKDVSASIGGWTNGNAESYATFSLDAAGHNGTWTLKAASGQNQRIGLDCSALENGKKYRIRMTIAISDGKALSNLAASTSRTGTSIALNDIAGNSIPFNAPGIDAIVEKTSSWSVIIVTHSAGQGHTFPVTVTISNFAFFEYIGVNDVDDAPAEGSEKLVRSGGVYDSIGYPYARPITVDDVCVYYNGSYLNRAVFYADVMGGALLTIKPKVATPQYQYQVNGVAVNSSHEQTSTVIKAWGGGASEVRYGDTYDIARVQVRKGTGSGTTALHVSDLQDFMGEYDIHVHYKDNPYKETPEAAMLPLGGLQTSGKTIKSDFTTKPKIKVKLKLHLPSWLSFRCNYGLRTPRLYSDYKYDGEELTLDYNAGGIFVEITHIDSTVILRPELWAQLVKLGQAALIVDDADESGVVGRNFDAEKYLGAIRATPGESKELLTIAHFSDIHGDLTRGRNICDYADHLGVDLLVNTGDNPFYTLSDGVKFLEEIVKAHKTDYATVVGNHDQYTGTLTEVFGKNIEPFATAYGYEKEGSDVTDVCYYFKDLTAQKLRVIALNIYDGLANKSYRARISETQMEWFIATLASTPQDYGVIVLLHQAPHTIASVEGKTGFNDSTMDSAQNAIDSGYMVHDNVDGRIIGNPLGKVIDAFIAGTTVSGTYQQKNADASEDEVVSYSGDFTSLASGVEFIAYMNGHTHRDFIGYVADCEEVQLNLIVASQSPISQSTGYKTPSDIYRDGVGANQDAFNIYTINRTAKTVGVARIGSNLANDLRERKVMYIPYAV